MYAVFLEFNVRFMRVRCVCFPIIQSVLMTRGVKRERERVTHREYAVAFFPYIFLVSTFQHIHLNVENRLLKVQRRLFETIRMYVFCDFQIKAPNIKKNSMTAGLYSSKMTQRTCMVFNYYTPIQREREKEKNPIHFEHLK